MGGGGGYEGYIVSRLYIVNKIKTEKKGLKNLNNIFGKWSFFFTEFFVYNTTFTRLREYESNPISILSLLLSVEFVNGTY